MSRAVVVLLAVVGQNGRNTWLADGILVCYNVDWLTQGVEEEYQASRIFTITGPEWLT